MSQKLEPAGDCVTDGSGAGLGAVSFGQVGGPDESVWMGRVHQLPVVGVLEEVGEGIESLDFVSVVTLVLRPQLAGSAAGAAALFRNEGVEHLTAGTGHQT